MLAILALLIVPAHNVEAATTTDLEYGLLAKINEARAEHGLRPLRGNTGVWAVAGTRAARLASTNILSHSVPGSIAAQLNARDVQWYAYGEDIGYTRARRGAAAVDELFRLWKASPPHWQLMMSSNYNYIGVGLAYRASNNKTFGSLVFTESRDVTRPRAYMDGASLNGSTATWSWHGADPVLQTHTAGIRSYDVQTSRDSGSWRTVASGTTATSRSWGGLSPGHIYRMRVRARDRAGNVGAWVILRVRP